LTTEFYYPAKKGEKAAGWIYLILHTFVISILLSMLGGWLIYTMDYEIEEYWADVAYYGLGFAFLLIAMNSFLRHNFSAFLDNPGATVYAVFLGYTMYLLGNVIVQMVVEGIAGTDPNPNSAAINDSALLSPGPMLAVGVFLAPVVEEILFRGVLFGTIRQRRRVTAYIVSALVFSFYHLWSYFLFDFDWRLFLYILQYIPGGLVLCWAYEKGGSIWSSIFLHMLINFISLKVTIG